VAAGYHAAFPFYRWAALRNNDQLYNDATKITGQFIIDELQFVTNSQWQIVNANSFRFSMLFLFQFTVSLALLIGQIIKYSKHLSFFVLFIPTFLSYIMNVATNSS
jgi:hypothetical protein